MGEDLTSTDLFAPERTATWTGVGWYGARGLWHGEASWPRMERNDAIAWAVATLVWIAVLALLLWLASRERRGAGPWGRWLWPRIAGGLALWVAVFGATRWAERKLGVHVESHARAVRSAGPHSGSRAP